MNEWLGYLGGLLVNEGTSATIEAKFAAITVSVLSAAIVGGRSILSPASGKLSKSSTKNGRQSKPRLRLTAIWHFVPRANGERLGASLGDLRRWLVMSWLDQRPLQEWLILAIGAMSVVELCGATILAATGQW
jgi:hypothetical protein